MGKDTIHRIEHEGRIVAIGETSISVEIINKSACSTCHAKSVCVASDESTRIIEIPYTISSLVEDYKIGDRVNVILGSSLGLQAVWISYVIPLFILMILILSLSFIGIKELYVGLCAIGGVGVYYACVYLFRDKLTRIFTFSIEKIVK